MPEEHQGEHHTEFERLLEFLYVAPVALIEFDDQGNVHMANPKVAQLFNRFIPGGYFENFFLFLHDYLPNLETEIREYPAAQGQIMENKRFNFDAPGADEIETMWIDVTVMRQRPQRYIASINDVTAQVSAAKQSHIHGQQLAAIFNNIEDYVIFTLDPRGRINSWNRSGELATGLSSSETIGSRLQDIANVANGPESNTFKVVQEKSWMTTQIEYKNARGDNVQADIMLSVMNGLNNEIAGYSAIIYRPRNK